LRVPSGAVYLGGLYSKRPRSSMASSTWARSPLARSHAVAIIGAEVLTDRTIPYGTAQAD
jgi:hypothetical protein